LGKIKRRVLWRIVAGGYYAVSNYGDVKRVIPERGTRPGRILKPYKGWGANGPAVVSLSRKGEREQIKVSDLLDINFPYRKKC
jgi:hypothetical protein